MNLGSIISWNRQRADLCAVQLDRETMAAEQRELTLDDFSCKVSSTLNRNIREYGLKYMFNDDPDTCWNSDQGLPQTITLKFKEPRAVKCIQFIFQGGFVGLVRPACLKTSVRHADS